MHTKPVTFLFFTRRNTHVKGKEVSKVKSEANSKITGIKSTNFNRKRNFSDKILQRVQSHSPSG